MSNNFEEYEFPKITSLKNFKMIVTQKLHGTNGLIYVDDELNVKVGSRRRWLNVNDDNAGFCKFVMERKEQVIEYLGKGRHYGEFIGTGIANTEGFPNKKVFALFNHYLSNSTLPDDFVTVPLLYEGKFDPLKIDEIMNDLKINGSKLVNGFMKVEGIVVNIPIKIGENKQTVRFKQVFDPEETKWVKSGKDKDEELSKLDPEIIAQIDALLQPIRLEKIALKESTWKDDPKKHFKDIFAAYRQDLIDENQTTKEFLDGEHKRTINKRISNLIGSELF